MKQTIILFVVCFKPYGIPYLRSYLPFVNKSRCGTLKQSFNVCFRHLEVLPYVCGVIHIQDTLSLLFCCCCLATSFRSFNKNSSHCF